jgi:hypothetical protein
VRVLGGWGQLVDPWCLDLAKAVRRTDGNPESAGDELGEQSRAEVGQEGALPHRPHRKQALLGELVGGEVQAPRWSAPHKCRSKALHTARHDTAQISKRHIAHARGREHQAVLPLSISLGVGGGIYRGRAPAGLQCGGCGVERPAGRPGHRPEAWP